MTRDNIHDLMMGAVAVALVYALYKHMQSASQTAQTFAVNNPIKPAQGTSYNPANPGAYISLASLLNGAVSDFNSGGSGNISGIDSTIPTISQLNTSVLDATYGGALPATTSVVQVPGAYW